MPLPAADAASTECHRLVRWIVTLLAITWLLTSNERETPPGEPVASLRGSFRRFSNERNDPQGKPGAFFSSLRWVADKLLVRQRLTR